ncbi:MAG: hypothetical protein DRP82_03065 [Planctomycetota bacterium]|nr:MAG: hypothetical protein DRP82_03065 [Planctomycetota bacterium]
MVAESKAHKRLKEVIKNYLKRQKWSVLEEERIVVVLRQDGSYGAYFRPDIIARKGKKGLCVEVVTKPTWKTMGGYLFVMWLAQQGRLVTEGGRFPVSDFWLVVPKSSLEKGSTTLKGWLDLFKEMGAAIGVRVTVVPI